MANQEELDEIKSDVERAFKAALFSNDYCILRVIIDSSTESRSAYEKQDYQSMLYSINKGFWDIGICIDRKLKSYSSVTPEFFDDISANIKTQLKMEQNIAFSPENLKRCLKIVNLTDEQWFEGIARQFSWQSFADALDQANSFDELKAFLSEKEPYYFK
jgi:hypothetical protein